MRSPPLWSGLVVAVVATAAGCSVDALLRSIFGPEPFLLSFGAVILSAWYGGWVPGLVATVLAGLSVEWFIITPFESVDRPTVVRLSVFLFNGTITSLLVRRLRRARDQARTSEAALAALNHELDLRVQDRTARLAGTVAELEAFNHTLAHTLRGPLRAVEGFADVLREDQAARLDDEGRRHLDRMSEAVRHMDHLVNDLLEHSRLGRVPIPLAAVPVEAMLADAVALALERTQHPRAPGVRLEPGLPEVVANRALLTRVMAELITNALVHGNGADVRARAFVTARHVRLQVEDHGPGIPAPHRERVFGLFERLSPRMPHAGTGSGLAIVRRAVERMGGNSGVETTPGGGSTFWITLPAADPGAEGGPPLPGAESVRPSPQWPREQRIPRAERGLRGKGAVHHAEVGERRE